MVRFWGAVVVCVTIAVPAVAQDHQYSAEQIQAGYRLYTGQCQLCHGPNGDGIAGVNLARQQFHTVVSDDRMTFKSRALDTGEKFSYTFTKAGTYPYFCSVHPKMTGQVVVQ